MNNQITALRENFIQYFRSQNHRLTPPSKVYLESDDTLLFVNAGMNQFKNRILKGEDSTKMDPSDKNTRLCNSQICIRAGGKHNDLDDVGQDSYHLTSFEMLGNWSLNNYRKQDAILYAYQYLIDHLHLDPNRIYVTYFGGDESHQLPPDHQSRQIWESIIVDARKVIPGSFKDNFWMMGDTGPCGACTEIHYDLRADRQFCPELVNHDDPEVIEIWNLVFMEMTVELKNDLLQFQPMDGDRFYVDTGMGLERLAMVCQQVPTVYQTDAFHYLFGYARALCNLAQPYSDLYHYTPGADQKDVLRDRAYRIFADHFRTLVVSLYDGIRFDITGRGNVLRKIFRRLLTNTYLYLNQMTVQPLMPHPITGAIITSILNYHLRRRHDREQLQELLIVEEELYLGILWNAKKRVQAGLKKLTQQQLSESEVKNKLVASLKKSGIPERIIDHIEELTINRRGR